MQTQTMTIRRTGERFHSKLGWLDSHHTFSFGEHHHPDHMGHRALRVINDDIVAPGRGFPTHPHRSMEIFTYLIKGGIRIGGETLKEGDGAAIGGAFDIAAGEQSEFLLFRLS